MPIQLVYMVVKQPDAKFDTMVDEIHKISSGTIVDGYEVRRDLRTVSISAVQGDRDRAIFRVWIDETNYELQQAGVTRLMTRVAGNSVRSRSIKSAVLVDINVSEQLSVLPGPRFGDALHSYMVPRHMPLISVNLPRRLAIQDWKSLVEALVEGGVNMITDPAVGIPELPQRLDYIENLCSTHGVRISYFVNGNIRQRDLAGVTNVIRGRNSSPILGVRVCPQSAGFGSVEAARETEVPVFAYPIAPIASYPKGWSRGAYAKMLRLVGADFASVSMHAAADLEGGATSEVIDSLCGPLLPAVGTTVPVLTGGIKPDQAYAACKQFGTGISLHAMSAILAGGADKAQIKMRVQALKEAGVAGYKRADPIDLFARNAPEIQNWKQYDTNTA